MKKKYSQNKHSTDSKQLQLILWDTLENTNVYTQPSKEPNFYFKSNAEIIGKIEIISIKALEYFDRKTRYDRKCAIQGICLCFEKWSRNLCIKLYEYSPEQVAEKFILFCKQNLRDRRVANFMIEALNADGIIKTKESLRLKKSIIEEYSEDVIAKLDEYITFVANAGNPFKSPNPKIELDIGPSRRHLGNRTSNSRKVHIISTWNQCCRRLKKERYEFSEKDIEIEDFLKNSTTNKNGVIYWLVYPQYRTAYLEYLAYRANHTEDIKLSEKFTEIHNKLKAFIHKDDIEDKKVKKEIFHPPIEILQIQNGIYKYARKSMKLSSVVGFRLEFFHEIREGSIVLIILKYFRILLGIKPQALDMEKNIDLKCLIKGGFPISRTSCLVTDKYGGSWLTVPWEIHKTGDKDWIVYLLPEDVKWINKLLQSDGMQGAPADACLIPNQGKWTTKSLDSHWLTTTLQANQNKIILEYNPCEKFLSQNGRKSQNIIIGTHLRILGYLNPAKYQDFAGHWQSSRNDEEGCSRGSPTRQKHYEIAFPRTFADAMRKCFEWAEVPENECIGLSEDERAKLAEEKCREYMKKLGYNMETGEPPEWKDNDTSNNDTQKQELQTTQQHVDNLKNPEEQTPSAQHDSSEEKILQVYENHVKTGVMRLNEVPLSIKNEIQKRIGQNK